MNIYIHAEISVRELDGKLLLAVLAAYRGHQVLISSLGEIFYGINSKFLNPGIFHTKSLTPGKSKIDRHQKIIDKNSIISSIDEESGIDQSGYDQFAKDRYSSLTIDQSAAVFGWGLEDTNTLKKIYAESSKKIHKTGSPRVDLWRPTFTDYWKAPKNLPQKPFLLISSNMFCTHKNSFHENYKFLSEAGYFERNPDLYKNIFYQWSEDSKKLYEFIDAIKYISKNNCGYDIVLRPHPTEDISAWRIFLKDVPNVHVIREESISAWVKYAFAIMHNGCTTAIEATILGKPVLTYNPFKMEYAHDLPNSLGFNINSKDKLLEKTNQLFELSKKSNFKIEKVDMPEQLLEKIYIDQDELASEKIIKVWETIDNKNLSENNNWYKFYCLLKILHIKKNIKKILFKIFPKNFKPSEINQKFPPLIENNIREKVSRIQNVIGIKKKIQCKLLSDRTILIRSL